MTPETISNVDVSSHSDMLKDMSEIEFLVVKKDGFGITSQRSLRFSTSEAELTVWIPLSKTFDEKIKIKDLKNVQVRNQLEVYELRLYYLKKFNVVKKEYTFRSDIDRQYFITCLAYLSPQGARFSITNDTESYLTKHQDSIQTGKDATEVEKRRNKLQLELDEDNRRSRGTSMSLDKSSSSSEFEREHTLFEDRVEGRVQSTKRRELRTIQDLLKENIKKISISYGVKVIGSLGMTNESHISLSPADYTITLPNTQATFVKHIKVDINKHCGDKKLYILVNHSKLFPADAIETHIKLDREIRRADGIGSLNSLLAENINWHKIFVSFHDYLDREIFLARLRGIQLLQARNEFFDLKNDNKKEDRTKEMLINESGEFNEFIEFEAIDDTKFDEESLSNNQEEDEEEREEEEEEDIRAKNNTKRLQKLKTMFDAEEETILLQSADQSINDFDPDRNYKILTATWNVGESRPPDLTSLRKLLPDVGFDIFAIGLQECNAKRLWQNAITEAINGKGKYKLVASPSLWAIHLFIFVKKSLEHYITSVSTSSEATGLGHVLGNKGGVGAGLIIDGVGSFAFVTSHLAARAKRILHRQDNFEDICEGLKLTGNGVSEGGLLYNFDHIFWFGDLNYRVDAGNHGTPEEYAAALNKALANDAKGLLKHDQLLQEREAKKVFSGFKEADINFAPTYRMLKKADGYSNKKFQSPSYTDRVLYRSLSGIGCSCILYSSVPTLNASDHRPVHAAFEVKRKTKPTLYPPLISTLIEQGIKSVPVERTNATTICITFSKLEFRLLPQALLLSFMKKNFYDGYHGDLTLNFMSPYMLGNVKTEKTNCLASSSATVIEALIEKIHGVKKDKKKKKEKDDIIIVDEEQTDDFEKYPMPEWHWNNESIPVLRPIITDMSSVWNERLVVSVCKDQKNKSGNNATLGYGELTLASLLDEELEDSFEISRPRVHEENIEISITRNGRVIGVLTGPVKIYIANGLPQQLDWFQNKEALFERVTFFQDLQNCKNNPHNLQSALDDDDWMRENNLYTLSYLEEFATGKSSGNANFDTVGEDEALEEDGDEEGEGEEEGNSLHDSQLKENNENSNRIGICSSQIYPLKSIEKNGKIITSNGQIYEEGTFLCSITGKTLKGKPFMLHEDKPTSLPAYLQIYGKNRCAGCFKNLHGNEIKVEINEAKLSQTNTEEDEVVRFYYYHPGCFTCTGTGISLLKNESDTCDFIVHEGQLFSKEIYLDEYHSCDFCGEQVPLPEEVEEDDRNRPIRATNNLLFHKRCFNCLNCKKSLLDISYYCRNHKLSDQKDDQQSTENTSEPRSKYLYCENCNNLFNPNCPGCDKTIDLNSDNLLNACHATWHVNCFCCFQCKVPLTGTYFEHDNVPYCRDHYNELFGDRCAKCMQLIEFESVSALGQKWHKGCFVCVKSGVAFETDEDGNPIFWEYLGKAYCKEEYLGLTSAICHDCDKIIEDKRCEALGYTWHPECLKCFACQKNLAFETSSSEVSKSVYQGVDENGDLQPFCENDFLNKMSAQCNKCYQNLHPEEDVIMHHLKDNEQKPVKADILNSPQIVAWHKSCIECMLCSKSLTNERIAWKNNFPFCTECFDMNKLLGLSCSKCRDTISFEDFQSNSFVKIEEEAENGKESKNSSPFFHKECYCCTDCQAPLAQGDACYESEEGFIYCYNDYIDLYFNNWCPTCKKPITGKSLKFLQKSWHSKCIACYYCDKSLEGPKYNICKFPKSKWPACNNHMNFKLDDLPEEIRQKVDQSDEDVCKNLPDHILSKRQAHNSFVLADLKETLSENIEKSNEKKNNALKKANEKFVSFQMKAKESGIILRDTSSVLYSLKKQEDQDQPEKQMKAQTDDLATRAKISKKNDDNPEYHDKIMPFLRSTSIALHNTSLYESKSSKAKAYQPLNLSSSIVAEDDNTFKIPEESTVKNIAGFRNQLGDSTSVFPSHSLRLDTVHDLDPAIGGESRMTGYLEKKGGGTTALVGRKNWQIRYFVLYHNTLMYFKQESDYLEGKSPLKDKALDIRSFSIADNGKSETGNYYEFSLTPNVKDSKKEIKPLYLRSTNLSAKEEWIAALSEIL